MSWKLIVALFGVFSWLPAAGQGDTTSIIQDFNKDGVFDTLLYAYDGGSGYGGMFATVHDGASDEVFELDTWTCFCTMRNTIPLAPEFKGENLPFLKAIIGQIFPEKRLEPESSLDWIIKAELSQEVISNDLFDMRWHPEPRWTKGMPELDARYYMELPEGKFNDIYHTFAESPEYMRQGIPTAGFLLYSNHSHGGYGPDALPKAVDSSKDLRIFQTAHGVFAMRDGKHKWLFISDFWTTGAPEKLRWGSIEDVRLVGEHVLILQTLPITNTTHIYVVSIRSGELMRVELPEDFFLGTRESRVQDWNAMLEEVRPGLTESELVEEFEAVR